MNKTMLELDLDELEKRGISRYKAVVMASQEARYLNDQVRNGTINETDKPTTVALQRLFDGQILEKDEENAIVQV